MANLGDAKESAFSPTGLSLAEAQTNIHLRHLEQLKSLDLSTAEPRSTEPLPTDSLAQSRSQLEGWSQDMHAQILKAEISCGLQQSPAAVDWNVAVLALLQSGAMYLRDDDSILNARQAATDGRISDAISLLQESQQAISEVANTFDMTFTTLCDLVQYSPEGHPFLVGPFCGAYCFAGPGNPFIVVAFKGTTFTDIGELIVDLDFYPTTPSNGQLFNAQVSRGIYAALFDVYNAASGNDAFNLISQGLQELALSLHGTAGKPVPVYVTGHSLGASYATLLYAQMVYQGVPSLTVLCDMLHFGSPRVGLNDFASDLRTAVAGKSAGASPSTSHIWRIVNASDIVPSVPPAAMGEPAFIHIDGGMLIAADAQPQAIPTEIGMGFPAHYFDGTITAHLIAAYYAAVKNAVDSNAVSEDTPKYWCLNWKGCTIM